MNSIKLAVIGAIALLALLALPCAAASANDNNTDIYADYWAFEMRINPFVATSSGIDKYNALVPDIHPETLNQHNEVRRQFLQRLQGTGDNKTVDDGIGGSAHDINAQLLRFILRHDLQLAEFDEWRMPFNSDSGFHVNLGHALGSADFRTPQDYTDYLSRLARLPDYIDQQILNMQAGLEDGFTQPQEIMANILPSFEALTADIPDKHPFYAPFVNLNPELSQQQEQIVRANQLFTESVIPAFERLHAFMRDQYLPRARTSLGASELPNGTAYYRALVRYYTSIDDAEPESIHLQGLTEVQRIRAEMEDIIQQSGFEGAFDEFIQFLRTDPQFYAKTAEELLMRAAWIAKTTDGKLPAFFGKLPRQPYSVDPVPAEIAANYTQGRYVSAAPGSDRGGQYWVNTYALDKRPLYQLPALSLHEGVPGHHLQGALAYEIDDVPAFRQQFYPHAFGEGWGLYAEKLGVEMGIYQTPYEHFGRLSYEMWRACRLVIDTGLHSKGWTRQQAVDYLAGNTALSLHAVNTEIDRYISWPGQALAYKTGELAIWQMRNRAEQSLGSNFDIREFHDAVLVNGGLPLDLLNQQIDRYIERKLLSLH